MATDATTSPDQGHRLVALPEVPFERWLKRRREAGRDLRDEVWEGVYVVAAEADNEHQTIGRRLCNAIEAALDDPAAQAFHGVNVSDRDDWRKNFRVPDVAVFLPGGVGEDRRTHWLRGPDFAVEVVSRRDRSKEKFEFYGKNGVREILFVNRYRAWSLELFRREGDQWALVATSRPASSETIASAIMPVAFRLIDGQPRPRIEVSRPGTNAVWIV